MPKEIAEYIVNIDQTGTVFVRTPHNVELMAKGELESKGTGFKRGKGVGQGDVPSPMMWVAAFDTLLTALAEINSGFKTQNINGRTRETKDVAFADDLICVTGSLKDLQEKADVISGWCVVTGIKIAISKLRTFGRQWGTRKEGNETGVIILNEGGGKSTEVEVKNEGIMTHLGVIWDMDLNGDK